MNELFGTKIKIVSGYPGGNAINLAVERGEVHGRCGWSWSGIIAERRQWIENARSTSLVQFGLKASRPAGCADDLRLRAGPRSRSRSCSSCWRASRSDGRSLRRRDPRRSRRCAAQGLHGDDGRSGIRRGGAESRSLRSIRCRVRMLRLWSAASSPPCRRRPWRGPRKFFRGTSWSATPIRVIPRRAVGARPEIHNPCAYDSSAAAVPNLRVHGLCPRPGMTLGISANRDVGFPGPGGG